MAIAAHKRQKTWLDKSQGIDSYLKAMDDMSLEVGQMSRRFKYTEGWRRHLHFVFCSAEKDVERKIFVKHSYKDSQLT